MQRERSDVYIIPPNFAKEGTLFQGELKAGMLLRSCPFYSTF